jgi:HD-like signal output (HDOD) protein
MTLLCASSDNRPDDTVTGPVDGIEELLARVEKLPAARPAVLRLLQVIDDPDTGSADVAKSAGADYKLAGRLMKLANSAYYGLGGRVSTLQMAVTVVGFDTVRAMAVAVAADLPNDPSLLPPLFWERAAVTAVASGVAATRVGAKSPEAFCAGLLVDIGMALLFTTDRAVYEKLPAEAGSAQLLAAERARFGVDHPELARRLVDSWLFPARLSQVIGDHHLPVDAGSDPLRLAVAAGQEMADRILSAEHGYPQQPTPLASLTGGKVDEVSGEHLLAAAAADAHPLIECLQDR